MLDVPAGDLSSDAPPDARLPLSGPHAPCDSYPPETPEFKLSKHGGARPGAGRPRKPAVSRRPPDEFRWYVARTGYGQTALADREIRMAGFTVFSPTIFKPAIPPRRAASGVMRPGKPDRVEFLFVRYVIVSLNLSDAGWRAVLKCDGVERIISGGHADNNGAGIPIAVPDRAIDWVRGLLGPTGCIDPRVRCGAPISAGTPLRLLDGPMPGREAVCEMSDGQRVVLLLNLFNRDNVRTSVAQSAVQAV